MSSQGLGETPWKVPGKWSVSPYCFEKEVRANWKIPPKITVHDDTGKSPPRSPSTM